jgi:hypothetical protein
VVELKDALKHYVVMQMLGELASFVAQWFPSCRDVARHASVILYVYMY